MPMKVRGLDSLKFNLKNKTNAQLRKVDELLTEGAEDIELRAKMLAPTDRNRLRGSISSKTSIPFQKVISAAVFYAPYQEFGTGGKFKDQGRPEVAAQFKGKSSHSGDFVKNIYDYIKRKGGFPAEARTQAQKVAYAKWVAMKILKGGIEPANNGQGFMYKAFDEIVPTLLSQIKQVLK